MSKNKIVIGLIVLLTTITAAFVFLQGETKYTVTFDNEGVLTTQSVESGNKVTKPNDPKKDHYIFDCWELDNVEYDFDTVVVEDITLKATYNKEVYSVTFVSDDEVVFIEEVVYNELATTKDVTKEGYIFVQWELDNEQYLFSTPIKENITLTALWISEEDVTDYYTVTFNDRGTLSTELIAANTLVKKPTNPTNDILVFSHWELDGEPFDFDNKITSNITLIAVWNDKEFTISFDTDGGNNIPNMVIKINEKITVDNPTKEHYIFKYWEVDGKEFNLDTPITSDLELKAIWEEEIYTVTFNDGTNTFTQEVKYGEFVVKPNNPTNQTKEFKFWMLNNIEFNFDTKITSDITLTAKWDGIEYTVTFDTNGGKTIPSQKVTINERVFVDDPSRDDYLFLYWELDDVKYDLTTPVVKDITLKAIWVQETFNISFNSSGGSSVDSQVVNYNGKIIAPNAPTKDNYDFLYWTESNNEEFDFDTLVTKDIVLVAVWGELYYTVTYDSNFGNEIPPVKVLSTQTVEIPTNPVRIGYVFLYWTLDNEQFIFGELLTSDITLVAQWTEFSDDAVYYTITFITNQGTTIDPIEVIEGGLVTKPTDPTRENYDFSKWTKNGIEFNFNTRIGENITLTATWIIHTRTVTFDYGEGSYVAPQIVDLFSRATSVSPTRNNYLFLYWELDGEKYNFSTTVTEDITLVAVWEEIIRYEVSFNSDGGSDVETQLIISGYTAYIPYVPTKDNYVFYRWTYEGEQYDFSTPIVKDIELKAEWVSSVNHVITFDTKGGSLVESQTINTFGTVMYEPTEKAGYVFLQWTLNGEKYEFNSAVESSFTLEAQWLEIIVPVYHTVTFVSNNQINKTVEVQHDAKTSSYTLTLTNEERHTHWTYANGETFDFNTAITADITLYAFWQERIFYNIQYNLNGGNFYNTSHPTSVEAGYKPSTFTNPTRNGYTFVQWQLPDGTKYTFNSVAATGNIYVEAIWNEVDLDFSLTSGTKTFNGSSTTFTVSGPTTTTGITIEYSNVNPTNDNLVFSSTKPSVTNVGSYTVTAIVYLDGVEKWRDTQTYTITPATLTVTLTGDAEYEYTGSEIDYNVTFNSSGWGTYDYYVSTRGVVTAVCDKTVSATGTYLIYPRLLKTIDGELTDNPNYVLSYVPFEIEVIPKRQYNYEYEIVNNEVVITGFYNTLQETLDVVSTIEGYPVTTIKANAFEKMTYLQTVVLPDTIKTIEQYAFNECTKLTSVILGSGVKVIEQYAFNGCTTLATVNYGNNLETIGKYAFYNCKLLSELSVSSKLSIVEQYAFRYCYKLTTLPFSTSIVTIETHAFCDCTSLVFTTFSSTLKTIGTYAFYNNDSLVSVVLPNSLTILDTGAFENSGKLESITLSSGLTEIADQLFEDCVKLAEVIIPSNAKITSVGSLSFHYTIISSIELPNTVVTIGSNAFDNARQLVDITIPNGVTSIGASAFRYCYKLETITLPSSLTTIGSSAFESCSVLNSIILPDSVSSIGSYAFRNCSALTSFTLPANIASIPSYMFTSCYSLTNIVIPNTVTSIGSDAFNGCSGVTSLTFQSGSNLATINSSAFSGMKLVESVTIPNSVTTIGSSAFYNWNSLKVLNIPSNVKTIGSSAFSNCTLITTVTVPNSVTSLSSGVFSGCTSLKTAIFNLNENYNYTTLGSSMFSGCTSLVSFQIPSTVKTIDDYAFNGCTSLTNITIPDSVTRINDHVFQNCKSLSNIIIPSSVTYLEFHVFEGNDTDVIIVGDTMPTNWYSSWNYGNTGDVVLYTE